MKSVYYAVRCGVVPGIYRTWEEAKQQVLGFSGAVYKKFSTLEEAERFLKVVPEEKEDYKVDCQLYVDGSYSKQTEQYGWSFVAVIEGESTYSKYGTGTNPKYLEQRQIAGEVTAVLQALDYAIYKGFDTVQVLFDYEGIEKWVTEEWSTRSEIAQAYKYLFGLKNQELSIWLTKVKAHSGDRFNEMADQLAKKAQMLN